MPAAEHVLLAQHGWPEPPHATHWLVVEQSEVDEHLVVPEQHGWPAFPQGTQLLFAPQTDPVLQLIDAQQIWVLAPHAVHCPPEQRYPEAHIEPAQHGWLRPPHAPHVPPAQTSPAKLHVPVPQQG